MEMQSATMNALLSQAQSAMANNQTQSVLRQQTNTPDEARKVAEEFESVFLNTMIESMFSGIKTDGPFSGGHGESVYRSMLNQEYAKAISRSGGIGIADQIYAEMLKTQEGSQRLPQTNQIQTK